MTKVQILQKFNYRHDQVENSKRLAVVFMNKLFHLDDGRGNRKRVESSTKTKIKHYEYSRASEWL